VEAGDQYPAEAYESQHQERVVEPQPAAHINRHQNACSAEHLFERKAGRQHKRVTRSQKSEIRSQTLLLVVTLLWLAAGCLPDPQRVQSVALFDQLVSARATLSEQTPQAEPACTAVGDVQTRLIGEPGLVDVRPAWQALRDAAQALQAVCGQTTLLGQPSTNSPASTQARDRWQQGIQREIGVACDHLRQAAVGLDRPIPC
jgi:hypothetical protein